jgi:2-polyprenyl-3-methyl-5-hydroxy-6-metoxy-1,4-benzoquinol methylase
LTNLYDDRFGQIDEYSVAYCPNCDFSFLRELISTDDIKALYNRYYPYEGITNTKLSWRYSNGLFQKLLRSLTGNIDLAYYALPGQKVLDVGCGKGVSLQILRLNGAIGTGLEIDERCIKHLRSEDLTCIEGTLEKYAKTTKERYDLIIMNQLLEHEYNPITVLRTAKGLLNYNGKIMVSCPNYNSIWRIRYKGNWIHWHVPFHVSYFTKKSFSMMSSYLGLEIEKFLTRTPLDWAAMNFYMRKRNPVRGYKNDKWRFSYPILQKMLFIPDNVFSSFINQGDAILVSLKVKR